MTDEGEVASNVRVWMCGLETMVTHSVMADAAAFASSVAERRVAGNCAATRETNFLGLARFGRRGATRTSIPLVPGVGVAEDASARNAHWAALGKPLSFPDAVHPSETTLGATTEFTLRSAAKIVLVDGAGAEVPVAVVDVTGVRARFEKTPGDADDALTCTVKTARVWSPAAERDAGRRALLSRARRPRRVGRPVASGRRASRGVDPLHRSERTARTPDGHDGSRRRARRGGVSHRELGGGGDGEFRREDETDADGRRDGRRDGRLQFRLRLGSRDASRVRIRQTHRSRLGDVRALASRRRRVRLRARTRFPRVARGSEARDATFPRRRRVGVLRPSSSGPSSSAPTSPAPTSFFVDGVRVCAVAPDEREWAAALLPPTPMDRKNPAAPSRAESLPTFLVVGATRAGDVPGRAIVRGGRSPRLRHRHPRNNRASGGRRARVRIRVRVVEGGDDGVVRRDRERIRGGHSTEAGDDGASSARRRRRRVASIPRARRHGPKDSVGYRGAQGRLQSPPRRARDR